MNKAGKGNGKMIGVYDKDDSIKTQAGEIAEYWGKKTGGNVSFSIQDVMRILTNNYHKELFSVEPSKIDLSRLIEIR